MSFPIDLVRFCSIGCIRLVWLALLGLLLFSTRVSAFVMGSDDRVAASYDDLTRAGISQVGVIRISDDAFVTAIVIGENCDVVVSAGHAAFFWRTVQQRGWIKGQRRVAGTFNFTLNPGQPEPVVALTLVQSGYRQKRHIPDDQYDWAIFRSAHPVMQWCRRIGLEHSKFKCNGKLLMAGYHYDMRQVRLLDKTCTIRDVIADRVIVHDCDTKDGSSGAPLLCVDSDVVTLYGINTSGLSKQSYVEPGVYGQSADQFDFKTRKNFAVAIRGEFLLALERELRASRERAGALSGPESNDYQ